jgi:hypothetical protein
MTLIRRQLWIVAVVMGIAFIALGTYTITEGLDAKDLVRAELEDEQVVTSSDASIPDTLVTNAATAQAEAEIIKEHTYGRFGPYTGMEREDPNRDTYLKGLTLRNSLNMAAMGFQVSDFVVGVGALVVVIGLTNTFMFAPLLYWTRDLEGARHS